MSVCPFVVISMVYGLFFVRLVVRFCPFAVISMVYKLYGQMDIHIHIEPRKPLL